MAAQFEVFNKLTSALNALGIKYTVIAPGAILGGTFLLSNNLGTTGFSLMLSNGFVTNRTYMTSTIIQYTWPLLDFVNRANQLMTFGNFEFKLLQAAQLNFRYSVPWSVIMFGSLDEVSTFVKTPSAMFTRFLPGMYEVMRTGNVGHAIEMCIQG